MAKANPDNLYPFEKTSLRRRGVTAAETRESVGLLHKRLGLTEAQVGSDMEHLLHRYVVAYPLNIGWYDRHKRSEQWRYRGLIALAVLVSLSGIAGTIIPVLLVSKDGAGQELVTGAEILLSQVGLLVSGGFGALKVLAAAANPKARMSVFWKARSDLSKRLYSFEAAWRKLCYVSEDDYPISLPQWTGRLQRALGQRLRPAGDATPEALLLDATRREALFLLIELRHDERFAARQQAALRKFLVDWLPAKRSREPASHPLRVLVAVDHEAGDPDRRAVLVDSWMQEAHELEGAGIQFEPLQEMTFPTWPEVEVCLKQQRVKNEPLRAGNRVFDGIKARYHEMVARGDQRFAALVTIINEELYR